MTRDEVINAFADTLRDMDDYDLNNFYGRDGRCVWWYSIKKDPETGEWDLRVR